MRHTLTIERDARAPSAARAALERLDGTDPALLANARLLVSEIVTNSVKYGEGAVVLTVDVEPRALRVEATDDGGGFTPVARSRPSTDVGGWGLYLVEALADRWGVHDGSTHVWFELRAP